MTSMLQPKDTAPSIVPFDPTLAADIDAVTAIYGDHVLHGTGSFEIVPPDSAEMRTRFASLLAANYPILLLKRGDAVLGFAYAGPHKARAAYSHTVEDSIYLHPDSAGKGFGQALLSALIAETKARGFKQVIAVIGDSANTPSIRLHARVGFAEIGIARQLGFKFDQYLDVVFMQLSLMDTAPPQP